MFVVGRNIFKITRYSRNIYKNIAVLPKQNFNVLEPKYSVQELSTNPGDTKSVLDTVNSQNMESNEQDSSQHKNEDPPAISYDAITKGDKELEHKLKVIMLEAEVLRQEGHPIPPNEYMKVEMWEVLLNLPSRSQRKKYLEYLCKLSRKKENELMKKIEKRKLEAEFKEANPPTGQVNIPIEEYARNYGLKYNNIFLRFHDQTINRFYNSRLVQAMQFGQKIVIDCGYDQHMTRRENHNCAKQIMLLFAENRISSQPFDIHYVNMNKESDLTKMLHKYIPTMYDLEFPMNVHEKSYLDLFPKENLVYLTPHCREEMDKYEHDAVYIVGGIVDKTNNQPLSLAKAKREGIRMAKFPFDKYLAWGAGSGKSLTLNQAVAILSDVKETGDWKYALRHVPRRKLAYTNESQNYSKRDYNRKFDFKTETSWSPKYNKRPSYMNE